MQAEPERVVPRFHPRALADAAIARSGLEHLQGVARGEPAHMPFGEVLGFRLVEVSLGHAAFEGILDERHFNLIGTVHGGLAASLIDSASGCAVYSMLPRGDAWTTVSLEIDYLRAMPPQGPIRCEGRVVRVGRRIGVADAEILDERGRLCARGSSRCLIMRAE